MSDFTDVKCTGHVFTGTGGDKSVSIAGSVRLFGFQWISGEGAVTGSNIAIDLINGTSSSDPKLIEYEPIFPYWPSNDNLLMIPGGGVVFEDGLYLETPIDGSNKPLIGFVSFLYQNG